MKTVKTTVATSELSSTIDLSNELAGIPKRKQEEILADIGELLVERTLSYLADAKSPVTGRAFKALSEDYKDKKQEETGSSAPNLDLTGSMVSSIDYKIDGSKITVGVFGDDAGKADGHNNFSGDSKLPTRQFLPKEGEAYTKEIRDLISDSVRFAKADAAPNSLESKLTDVETKSDLYAALEATIGPFSRAKLKEAALASNIRALLEEYDMLDLL